jgi:extracellular elastinolytic metalloproteinase
LTATTAQISGLQVARDHELPGTGTHVVTFAQVWDGVAAAHGGRLNVSVANDGKVLSYAGNASRGDQLAGSFSLSAGQALGTVAGKLAQGTDFTPNADGTIAGYTTFAKGPFAASSYVKKIAFPTKDGARAAFQVLFIEKLDEAYDTVVDATTGDVLFRGSLVDNESEGTVYENFPGAPKGRTPVVRSFGPTTQSPSSYVDPSGVAGLPGPTTLGNNASTYANYSNFLAPADTALRPVNPTGQFNYPYEMNWEKTNGAALSPSYAMDLNPAATNLFWTHNRHPRRVLRPRLHRDGGQLPDRRRRPGPRPRARRSGQRRRTDLHRARQRLLPAPARRHPVVERHVPVGADQRRVRGSLLRRQLRPQRDPARVHARHVLALRRRW